MRLLVAGFMKSEMKNIKEIAASFKKTVSELYGQRLVKVVLYGSYARGDFHEESDVDFLIVLSDAKVKTFKELRLMNDILYDWQLKNDILVSHHPLSLSQYEKAESFFLKNVKKEGIEI